MSCHQAVVHELAVLLGVKHSSLPQQLQMSRELGLRFPQAIHQLAQAGFTLVVRKKSDDADTGGVGECLKQRVGLDMYDMHSCMLAQVYKF